MGKKTKANAYNIIREPPLNLLRVIKEKKLVTNYATLILLKKITKSIQFASLIAGSRSLELRNILKSKSSFSFFPYFISAFHSSSLISFSVCYVVSLLQYYIYIYISIFSKSFSYPQFFLLFLFLVSFTFHSVIHYNNSTLDRRDSTSIPVYNSFFRSFLKFSTTTSLSLYHSQNGTSVSKRRTPGYRKLGYSNLTHRSRCER